MAEPKIANECELHSAVRHIKINVVELLLSRGSDILVQDEHGSSSLHIAFEAKERGKWKTCQEFEDINAITDLILEANTKLKSNPINKNGLSHFHIACTRDEPKVIEHFMKCGAPINEPVSSQCHLYKGFTPLHFAAKFRCTKTLELLLKNGADVNQANYEKKTALHFAAQEPCSEGVSLLLQYGADISVIDSHGNSPVHWAYEKQNYAIIDLLLSVDNVADSNPVNTKGLSHFHIACTRNNVNVVKSFIDLGTSVETCVSQRLSKYKDTTKINWSGFSPLHFAVRHNRAEIVELLLHSKANVGIKDSKGFTPLHILCQYNCEMFREFIRNILCDLHKRGKITLSQFKPITDTSNVCEKTFGSVFGSMKKIDWSSNRKDHLKIIKLLLNNGSDVNCNDNDGCTPIFYAYSSAELGLNTLEKSLDCSKALSTHIMKSLFKEVHGRRKLILSSLLKLKVNFDSCYKQKSILHHLSLQPEWNDYETMELFLKAGANVDDTGCKMWTPLYQATIMECSIAVRVLLDYGANVDFVNPDDNSTSLHLAAEYFNLDIIETLIDKGAKVNAKTSNGSTPLHIIIDSYTARAFGKACLEHPNFRIYNDDDMHIDPPPILIIDALIKGGADVNSQDSEGFTPLHLACQRNIPVEELFSYLLAHGADINVEDEQGRSVCCYLYENIYKLSGRLLKSSVVLMCHVVEMRVIGLSITKKTLSSYDKFKAKGFGSETEEDKLLIIKCESEVRLLKDTQINDNCTLYNFVFKDENALSRLVKNATLQAIVQSHLFDKTYVNYGYLIRLKYQVGLDRADLLPMVKSALNFLAGLDLPDVCFEHICSYFRNFELKESMKTLSSLFDCNAESSNDKKQLRNCRINKGRKVN